MSNNPYATAGVVALSVVLLTGAVQVQAARERAYPELGAPAGRDEWLYLQSGPALRWMTGPLRMLAADFYWIRVIQYYGDTKRRLAAKPVSEEAPPMLKVTKSSEYTLLYPLLDITTTLDPGFRIAYRFGAVFLAEPYPGGPGRPDLAQALLEKGIRSQPDRWEYMEDIGFVHYWYGRDYRAAAGWFQRASEVPGAPWWLRSLAGTILLKGGDRPASRAIWEGIRQSAQIEWLRQDAERRLDQLQALDWIDQLQRRVDSYTKAAGAPPPDWQTLVRAGVFNGVPLDPRHVPFELAGGRVQVSKRSSLWPMPEEPQRTGPPAS
jgi:hypothetical protein